MKNPAPLFFVLILGALVLLASRPDAGLAAERLDVAAELGGKTFFVVEVPHDKVVEKSYQAYFRKDGTIAIKFNPTHSKSAKWEVDSMGTLCISTLRRKSRTTTALITKCGRMRKKSDTYYQWYNGAGELRAHFNLKGQGDRLP